MRSARPLVLRGDHTLVLILPPSQVLHKPSNETMALSLGVAIGVMVRETVKLNGMRMGTILSRVRAWVWAHA